MSDQPDMFGGRKLRDIGLELVLEHNPLWSARYRLTLPLLVGQRLTGEEIRGLLQPIIGEPDSMGAWGAAVMHAIRRGALIEDGERGQMRQPSSHAHGTAYYRVVGL